VLERIESWIRPQLDAGSFQSLNESCTQSEGLQRTILSMPQQLKKTDGSS
jgi:hypothetical protein